MSAELIDARYVSLATFRRSGELVATPVWCAEEAGSFYMFSAREAGKVKRLRNSDCARMAACDVRGKLLGDWHPARAEIISEPEDIRRALTALRRKYGAQMWVADVGAKLTGRYRKRAYIRARLTDDESRASSERGELFD